MIRPILERIFHTVFRVSRYYAWWVLLVTVLLTGFTIYYVRNVPIRSSFLDLLPSNDPLIEEYRRNEQYLAQTDFVALLLTLNEKIDALPSDVRVATQRLKELKAKKDLTKEEVAEIDQLTYQIQRYRKEHLLSSAKAIAMVLAEDEAFLEVTYLLEPSQRIPAQYLPLFTLDKEKLARIKDSMDLARQAIVEGELSFLPGANSVSNVYREFSETLNSVLLSTGLSSETAGMTELEARLEPIISLNEAILETLGGMTSFPAVTAAVQDLATLFTPASTDVIQNPEGLFSLDRTQLLMTVRPRYPSQRSVAYSEFVMETLKRDLTQVDLDAQGVTVEITGTYALTASTNAAVNADMLRTTIIASVGVFVIFLLAFGSFFYSVIAVIPLMVTVLLTIAWTKLAMQGFNLVTTFIPALVLGLGIDYAIHLIARYAEERAKGRSLNQALYTAVLRKGEASFLAALTTTLVFLGLLTARSRALFEMGAITSVGVLLAFLATLFLIPSLITLRHFIFRSRYRENVISYVPYLSRYFRFIVGKGRVIFVIVLILTFFVTFQAAQTRFKFSSDDLVPRVESQEVYDEILKNFGAGMAGLGSAFTFYADSEEELKLVVTRLKGNKLVQSVESAWDYLPVNLAEQQQVLKNLNLNSYIEQLGLLDRSLADRTVTLAQIRTLLAQFSLIQYGATLTGGVGIALAVDEIQTQLQELREKLLGINLEAAHATIVEMQDALRNLDKDLTQIRDLPPLETLLRDVLELYPESIRSRYVTPEGKYIIQARVSREIFEGDNLREFDAFAASFSNDCFGMPLVGKRLEDYMKRDFLISTLLAAGLILLTLWRSLGNWMRALLAAAPLVLGYIWMLGGMRLLQIDFNFINITISPLLIGIGVDNAIHILHRYFEERALGFDGAIMRAGETTAIPVIVTSLTTMLVFASLLLGRTPGLRFLGTSALLGIGFTLLFTLLFLPAALHVEGGKRV
jgi:hypothetical protein